MTERVYCRLYNWMEWCGNGCCEEPVRFIGLGDVGECCLEQCDIDDDESHGGEAQAEFLLKEIAELKV